MSAILGVTEGVVRRAVTAAATVSARGHHSASQLCVRRAGLTAALVLAGGALVVRLRMLQGGAGAGGRGCERQFSLGS
eukprot:COSAG02_NODE_2901_length_7778_cov_16.197161_5_plen_78_part_00